MPSTRYQLDPTGINPNNLVVNELHTVRTTGNSTVIPVNGAYYTESLVIHDNSNMSVPLIRGKDYACLELVEDATAKYGKEICQLILFYKNPLTSKISINYQAVGGYYSYQTNNIQELYNKVLANSQTADWYNLINKPLSFVPSEHVNMLEDIYGFEPVIYALERIREVIGLTNSVSYQSLIDSVNDKLNEVTKESVDKGLQVTNYVGLDMLLYFMTNFIGDATLDFTKTMRQNGFDINIVSTNMPNGFRLYWDMSDYTTNQIYQPATGKVNINNDSAIVSVNTSGSITSNSNLQIRLFSNVGPVVASYNILNDLTTLNISACMADYQNPPSADGLYAAQNITTI